METSLSNVELVKLENFEVVIAENLQAFLKVGKALMEIRDERLYRATHETFEAYCEERWSISKVHAYRLVNAAETATAIAESNPLGYSPENERQVRPLSQLPVDDRAEAWEEAVEEAGGEVPTAAQVQEVVSRRLATDEPAPPSEVITDGAAVRVESISDLSGEKFGCIYADPPWAYSNQATRASTDNHYHTMTVDELCGMPVADLAADDAHLHLWTTNAFVFDAKQVIEAWGFEYRSMFIWVKPQMGIGNYWRVSHEILLTAVRGNAKRFNAKNLMSWGEFDRGRHSAKPEEVRAMIEQASPNPRLELFGRTEIAGWTVYGNEIERRLFA